MVEIHLQLNENNVGNTHNHYEITISSIFDDIDVSEAATVWIWNPPFLSSYPLLSRDFSLRIHVTQSLECCKNRPV